MSDVDKFFGSGRAPSILNNPFNMRCVKSIHMHMYKNSWDDSLEFDGRVCFTNGKTSGEQKFEGSDFQDLMRKIYNFCSSLG